MATTSPHSPSLARLVQDFFVERLIRQRAVSPCTVASYRDTFRLLLSYVACRLHREPDQLALSDLDASTILAFLDHLEQERDNSVSTRNLRLAAIRTFMHFAAHVAVEDLPTVRQVLAVPVKRGTRKPVDSLSRTEVKALLDAADQTRWSGARDWLLLQTLYNTGARVSEATAMTLGDLDLDTHPQIRIHGKGRKERAVPLWPETAQAIRRWRLTADTAPQSPLLPDRHGHRMTRSGVSSRLQVLASRAITRCPTLRRHRIAPHLIRHTTAMHLLQAGVDLSVIAMWLGHESIQTTHQYMEADMALKRSALDAMDSPGHARRTRRLDDRLLRFLASL